MPSHVRHYGGFKVHIPLVNTHSGINGSSQSDAFSSVLLKTPGHVRESIGIGRGLQFRQTTYGVGGLSSHLKYLPATSAFLESRQLH